jgi:Carboxypeptidase regulatory-like domain
MPSSASQRIRTIVSTVCIVVFISALAFAQSATTSLNGTVYDAGGAVVPNAEVAIANPSTGYARTVKTDAQGAYQVLQIPPATYVVTVYATGFAPVKRENVVLQVSSPATLNFNLKVTGSTVEIDVTGEAPLVNSQDATLGNNFDSRQLIDLPSEGRDPASILSLQPGVTYIGKTTHGQQDYDTRGGAVNGARSDQSNITLDGLDDNDQLTGYSFEGALRTTMDSLQEFRVTTSNYDAESGRSSGAQVNLVTKSGTNNFHGSLYEYHRPTFTSANDWFNKEAQLRLNEPNRPGKVLRNTFGATFGGPIKRDRLFFFNAYEGYRSAEAAQVTRTVPSDLLRQGTIQYLCDPSSDSNCVVGSAGGVTVLTNPTFAPSLVVQLAPTVFAGLDQGCVASGTCPLGPGANPLIANLGTNSSAIFARYPHPNSTAAGDGLNFLGYTFPAPDPTKHDTYIVKLDYKLSANGNHSLFIRGNLQNDHESVPPQFLGQPASIFATNNSKGVAVGYTAVLTPTFVNNFRYAFVRQGLGEGGLSSESYIHFRGLDDSQAFSNTTLTNVPVHNLVDDVSWTKGKHTIQFGANLRLVHNNRLSNAQNYTLGTTNVFWMANSGIANTGASLDPSINPALPLVTDSYSASYDFAAAAVAGLISEVTATANKDKTGANLPSGSLVPRHFKGMESEFYLQDKFRMTPNFVVTYGLRYSLLQPPYEAKGNQAAPTINLHNWFLTRGRDMLSGIANQPDITFDLSGQANGRKPYWDWDYKDIAPRISFAYSPHASGGFWHKLFGDAGKSSIRAGYGIYFDHFGEGIVNTFDRQGSFGLTTTVENPAGVQTVDGAPRFTGLIGAANIPAVISPPPPGPFPYTPSNDPNTFGLAIAWGLDDKLKTPYSHVMDFSISRELPRNFALEVTYTGRLGRRLLQEVDLAQPLNLVDPKSHVTYFQAAQKFSRMAAAGTNIADVQPAAYWEDLFPKAAGPAGKRLWGCGGFGETAMKGKKLTATQAMYDTFACNLYNETTALEFADAFCFPACSGPSGDTPFQFYQDQFSSLYAWQSRSNSVYHGLQVTLRKAMSNGLQFDANYTFSKSIDVSSNAERTNSFEGGSAINNGLSFNSQAVNAWAPDLWRAVSDFDTTHQFNANWIWEIPYGKGHRFGGGAGRIADAVLGGWGFNGLYRWTSGFPFTVNAGQGWATNFELNGSSILTGPKPKTGVYRDPSNGDPTVFRDPISVGTNLFRPPYPGEAGNRNLLRGPGYFEVDTGLSKAWAIRENNILKFDWEIFNLTNSVRFDAANSLANQDLADIGAFGRYTTTLTKPRIMQFSLRFTY